MANPFARDITGEFVQFQRKRQPLFARHLAVTGDLGFQCSLRCHPPASYPKMAMKPRRKWKAVWRYFELEGVSGMAIDSILKNMPRRSVIKRCCRTRLNLR